MSDIQRPVVSEFERRRAMENFAALFDLCHNSPDDALELLHTHMNCTIPYTVPASALFLMGILYGILRSQKDGTQCALEKTLRYHADVGFAQLRPRDYLGDKRSAFIQPV